MSISNSYSHGYSLRGESSIRSCARVPIFGLGLHLHQYFVNKIINSSGESAHLHMFRVPLSGFSGSAHLCVRLFIIYFIDWCITVAD